MYYIVYKTTNLINDKYYIGFHKCESLYDGYLGSGKILKRSILKYGIENFNREILYFCDNESEMKEKENELVNKNFIKDINNYNLKIGGSGGFETGYVITSTNERMKIKDFYNSNSVGVAKGKIAVFDCSGNTYQVKINDKKIKSGEYTYCFNKNGNISAIDKFTGEKIRVTKEEFDIKDNLISIYKNTTFFKDINNNKYRVSVSDERYLSGELVGITKGLNYNISEYNIYDNFGNLQYNIKNENIITFCKEKKLPYGSLIKSYQNNGSSIYSKIGSNKDRLEKNNLLQYKGWYCLKIK